MPFTDAEEDKFLKVAKQLPQLYTDPEYEPTVISLLSVEEAARFEAWQSEQREKRFNALFDHRKAPSTTELVDAIKSIDFAVHSTFEDFEGVAFRVSNTPRVPLFVDRTKRYTVQLGSGISSPRPPEPVKPSTSETVPDATWHKYAQAFARDSNQTAPKYPRRRLLEYGFSIGTIMAEDRYGTSAEIEDTGFVLVLSARDKSLWMIYDYYPFNDEGYPAQFEPLVYGRLFQGETEEDLWFDCVMLYGSVSEWDPKNPEMAIPYIHGYWSLPIAPVQLVATPANSGHFKEFLSTLSGSQSASAPSV